MSETTADRINRLTAELAAAKGKTSGEISAWCRAQKCELFATPDSEKDLQYRATGSHAEHVIMLTQNFVLERVAEQIDKGI